LKTGFLHVQRALYTSRLQILWVNFMF
jgi:hypothetical protein